MAKASLRKRIVGSDDEVIWHMSWRRDCQIEQVGQCLDRQGYDEGLTVSIIDLLY